MNGAYGSRTRRAVLAAAAGVGAAVAGCTAPGQTTNGDDGGDGGDDPTANRTANDTETATPTPPPDDDVPITTSSDVVYRETDERTLHLDLTRADDDVDRPLLVHVHGGGWRRGDKGYAHAERVARTGLVVASVQYRLSGEAPYPAAVRDVVAAITWLRANADEWGIDPDRVALVGESAGGHLATLVGNAPDRAAYQPVDRQTDESAAVDAVVSISGIYDLRLEGTCTASVTEDFLEGSCEDQRAKARSASPVTHVDGGDPPTLLYHGTDDEVVAYEQATTYRDALVAEGVDVDLHTDEGGGHLLEDGAEAFLPEQRAFLQRTLDVGE